MENVILALLDSIVTLTEDDLILFVMVMDVCQERQEHKHNF